MLISAITYSDFAEHVPVNIIAVIRAAANILVHKFVFVFILFLFLSNLINIVYIIFLFHSLNNDQVFSIIFLYFIVYLNNQ